MHIRAKDINSALAAKDEALAKGIVVDGETFGLLINSLTERDMVVEGLQVVGSSIIVHSFWCHYFIATFVCSHCYS
jgi:hypothetical protein